MFIKVTLVIVLGEGISVNSGRANDVYQIIIYFILETRLERS
jgi:hypothetical protein